MVEKTCNSKSCTPANTSIECTVRQCAHHCENQNYCTLNTIRVVTHEANPTEVACTDCSSFQKKQDA